MGLPTGTAEIRRASVKAPVNIAVVKYWGKRDAGLNLPTNDSISVTLSTDDLCTHTTASICPLAADDTINLNDKGVRSIQDVRTRSCLAQLRALRKSQVESTNDNAPHLAHLPIAITTRNNFPTAAGVASSASGFAGLVYAVARLFDLPTSRADLSRIARTGSGSACRSLFGGYAQWHAGSRSDGLDSTASQLAPASHWPEMRALILIASAKEKDVGSTDGMQRTAATSALFTHRVESVVPRQMRNMAAAIEARDWETFATVTMAESNNFHATCLDTSPPIFYMNQVSFAAVKAVEMMNAAMGRTIACYTFDAGPNAVVFYQVEDEALVYACLEPALGELLVPAQHVTHPDGRVLSQDVINALQMGISRVIRTRVGEGCYEVCEHVDAME